MLYDVVVIGGGPIGSQVAYRLSVQNYSVAVLEQKPSYLMPVCCTGIISSECVNTFNLFGESILRPLFGARLISPAHKYLSVSRKNVQAYLVDRPVLDNMIMLRAKEAGARYFMGMRAIHVDLQQDFVMITVSNNNNKEVLKSRCAVIASGFSNKFTPIISKTADFAVGVQSKVEIGDLEETEVYFGRRVAPGFFSWLVPVSEEAALVGLISRNNPRAYLKEMLASMAAKGKIKSDNVKISARVLPLKSIPGTYGNRTIIVGSAAGQVKPLTGGGIYYGLLCADIAAKVIGQALVSDNLSSNNLSVYETGWRKILDSEINTSYRARKFFEMLNDWQIDKIFEIAGSSGLVKLLLEAEDVSFDWHKNTVQKLFKEKLLKGIEELIKAPFNLLN